MNQQFEAMLNRLIEKYGKEKQIIKAIEEMAELQKELCKYLIGDRSENRIEKIYDEIADVKLLILQLEVILELDSDRIAEIMQEKIERTLKNNGNVIDKGRKIFAKKFGNLKMCCIFVLPLSTTHEYYTSL